MSPFLDTAAICHRFIDISTAAYVTFTAICRHFVVSISLRHLPPSRCLISVSLPHISWRLLRTPSPPVLFHVSLSFPTLTIRKYQSQYSAPSQPFPFVYLLPSNLPITFHTLLSVSPYPVSLHFSFHPNLLRSRTLHLLSDCDAIFTLSPLKLNLVLNSYEQSRKLQ